MEQDTLHRILTTLHQTYSHTEDRATSFLRNRHHLCSDRRAITLRQRSGEVSGSSKQELEPGSPQYQPFTHTVHRYKRSHLITLTVSKHLPHSQRYLVARSRHISSLPTAQSRSHPNGSLVRATSTTLLMARPLIVQYALCSLPSPTTSGPQFCSIIVLPTSTKTIDDTSSR